MKKMKTLHGTWALKLMKSGSFVILTDTEAFVNIEGKPLDKLDDRIKAVAQTAALEAFYERLGDLIKEHHKVVYGKAKKRSEETASKRTVKKS